MKKKIVSSFFFRWRHISSFKFNQGFLLFFDEEYKLKSESSSLTKLWAIEEEPKWNPSLTVEPIPNLGRPKSNSSTSIILFGRSILDGKEMWLVSSGTVTWGWGGGEVHSDKLESHSSSWEVFNWNRTNGKGRYWSRWESVGGEFLNKGTDAFSMDPTP